MAGKSFTSQWDFGELFPREATRRVLTVSELTAEVKRLLQRHVGQVWVAGEVTNRRVQPSGHVYFTLKDAGAQLSCVLFRGEAAASREWLEDGRKVLVHGELTVYEPRGQYQLVVTAVELHGVGALQQAFERLKRKLQTEGLFALERKRPLPRYPQRVGVVTSPAGAALRDLLHVVQRRHPALVLVLAPCRVQGQGAAEEIAAAIRLLNRWSEAQPPAGGAGQGPFQGRLDLIVVTRGGGSLEDLWAFNEEAVARAVYESALPVVSAVGHEIDFTIADFVADLRAATPSAAAELITQGAFACREFLDQAPTQLAALARRGCRSQAEVLAGMRRRLARAHPRQRLRENWQRLDELLEALRRGGRHRWRELQGRWDSLAARWTRLRPALTLARRAERLGQLRGRLAEQARWRWQERRTRLAALTSQLRLLSPLNVLARGYSITRDEATGRILRSAQETRSGQALTTRLHEGEVRSVIE